MTVPFVVRQELGYQDRDQYKVLTALHPGQDWSPLEPQAQWNHKLVITGGGGCGADHGAGTAPLNDFSGTIPSAPGYTQSYIAALGRGFAVMSTALETRATTALATRPSADHGQGALIENYGRRPLHDRTGCSAARSSSNGRQRVSGRGLRRARRHLRLTGRLSAGAQFADYHLLRPYSREPRTLGTGIVWPPVQWGLVEGADRSTRSSPTRPLLERTTVAAASGRPDDAGAPACGVLEVRAQQVVVRELRAGAQDVRVGAGDDEPVVDRPGYALATVCWTTEPPEHPVRCVADVAVVLDQPLLAMISDSAWSRGCSCGPCCRARST